MTEIARKALALVNEVREGRPYTIEEAKREYGWCFQAVCLAIKRHEIFRQDVSDELLAWFGEYEPKVPGEFARFIIPKPDPLVDAIKACNMATLDGIEDAVAHDLRAAMKARGYEWTKIVEDK